MAGLVDELRRQEDLDLTVRRRQHERREVGGHPLLSDVEIAERPDRVALPVTGRRQPVLLVDREVDLVGLPVLALPECVELLVGQ